ncbi:small multi-drug export protein [Anaerofilum sp. BX8]|uniref:Small multi-drug export protein n=1 Tax=Anaerofilum hominis TaxID=2763016 RepID=A0A923L115_9FIRM|nr:small multi-drug export protein [Anaerofilum hominis]MBC5581465.1 small multi-drug export protein [Anaerofilum hominis]
MLTLFKKYFWVFLVSMVPIVELRGAIPIGVGSGLPLAGTYITAIIGNMLPVPVIILFSKKVLLWCCKLPGRWGKPFDWIYRKGVKAGDKMQEKAGRGLYFALFLFVAIPLPGTGAWTGSLAATLLDMKFWPSVLAVTCGVLTAGVIMGALSAGLFGGLGMLFA